MLLAIDKQSNLTKGLFSMMTNYILKDGAEIHVMNVVNLGNLDAFKRIITHDLKELVEELGTPVKSGFNFKKFIVDTGAFILVTHQKKLIACLTFTVQRIPTKTRGIIDDVVVAEEWRRRGVGKILVERAIMLAREYQCDYVQLTTTKGNVAACKFYEAIGFRNVEGEKPLYRYHD
ncbi:MAG: GNAT family N-acetyltransferase [Patescibacteria group bacterium]